KILSKEYWRQKSFIPVLTNREVVQLVKEGKLGQKKILSKEYWRQKSFIPVLTNREVVQLVKEGKLG
ncbi:hypothetical protein R5L03_19830, partial [Acinetobacter baumannii]|nr:hypothetical protein [Acinetobacter baumannii]